MNHEKSIFISGTGTDVGKTIIASALLWSRSRNNNTANYWKPIQTGPTKDASQVKDLCPTAHIFPTVYDYPDPASPDQAANTANVPQAEIDFVVKKAEEITKVPVIVEGAGGILVPFNNRGETWKDFIKDSQLPLVIVGHTGLGTINHTAMSVKIAETAGLKILGVVLQGEQHEDNFASLQRMFPHIRFHHFPKMPELNQNPDWETSCNKLHTFVDKQLGLTKAANIDKIDKNHCWHPYTQHKTHNDPEQIIGANGVWYQTNHGKLLDTTSSWWVNTVGHGRPEIGEAIHRQQAKLDHSIFANATHEPGALLAQRLAELTEQQLPKIFYTDNGSCAVEVGMKMAAQKWVNRGETNRNQFLSFKGSYHGDTFGTMSVAASDSFHNAFTPWMFKTLFATPITKHKSSICPEGKSGLSSGIAQLEQLFEQKHSQIAGVLIEPLVQGASGMNMQLKEWFETLGKLCQRYEIPLILDEVFTGMGRLGSPFAWQQTSVIPDIICIAKGLTGGTIPLAATLASNEIYNDFLYPEKEKALLHGHSFTGNPIACAAALAALDIYEKENLMTRGKEIQKWNENWLNEAEESFKIKNPRTCGAVLAFELPGTASGDYFSAIANEIPKMARKHGLFLRPLGSTIYLVPALSITNEEYSFAVGGLTRILKELERSGT